MKLLTLTRQIDSRCGGAHTTMVVWQRETLIQITGHMRYVWAVLMLYAQQTE